MIMTLQPTLKRLHRMASEIRTCDAREAEAVTGTSVEEALWMSVSVCENALFAMRGMEMLGLFGCRETDDGGMPWFIGTEAFDHHPKSAHQFAIHTLGAWKLQHSSLYNWVYGENVVAHKWLEHLGFTLMDPAPYGARGEDFRFFHWRLN